MLLEGLHNQCAATNVATFHNLLRWDYEPMGIVSQGTYSVETQPKAGVVAYAQEATPRASSRWKWFLCATAVVAVIVAVKYFHVQDLLKAALDWIGKLGPLGPVIFVGLYVVATLFFILGSCSRLGLAPCSAWPLARSVSPLPRHWVPRLHLWHRPAGHCYGNSLHDTSGEECIGEEDQQQRHSAKLQR